MGATRHERANFYKLKKGQHSPQSAKIPIYTEQKKNKKRNMYI